MFTFSRIAESWKFGSKAHEKKRRLQAAASVTLETLEARQLLSAALPFNNLAAGFTQELVATLPGQSGTGGFGFDSNGNVYASAFNDHLYKIDMSSTVAQPGAAGQPPLSATIHPVADLGFPTFRNPSSPYFGRNAGFLSNMTAYPDGTVYTQSDFGVVQIDLSTATITSDPIPGAPVGYYGIYVDPQLNSHNHHDIWYRNNGGSISVIDPVDRRFIGTVSSSVNGYGLNTDGMAIDSTGNYLFTAYGMQVWHRLPSSSSTPDLPVFQYVGSGGGTPDGMSFATIGTQQVVVTNDSGAGTVSSYSFSNNDFSQAPVRTVIASGAAPGTYGDQADVGPDGYLYLTQWSATRFADGTVTNNASVVRLGPAGRFLPATHSDSISLTPATDTLTVGSSETFTANLVRTDVSTNQKVPVVGTDVTFTVVAGPDIGQTFTGQTDDNGNVTYTLTNTHGLGADVVHAQFVDVNHNTQTSNNAVITFVKANVSISVTPYDLTYDATAHAATGTAKGIDGVDLAADLVLTGTSHTGAGTYTDAWTFHDPTGQYNDANGTITDVVAPRDLYVSPADNDKTYGQSASESGSLTGVQGVDRITAVFSSVGDDPGADAGSYSIGAQLIDPDNRLGNYAVHLGNATLTVDPAHLAVVASTNTKTYGQASSETGTISGIQNDDGITAHFFSSGDASTADAGAYAISASLSGAKLAQDYVVDSDVSNVGTLTVTPLAITGSITAANKVYDGIADASITSETLNGVIGTDDVRLLAGTAVFSDKNVGTTKVVTATGLTLAGAKAGDYVLVDANGNPTQTKTTTADITPLEIAGSITAADKTYDATTAATITSRKLTGVVAGDDVTLVGGSALFSDKNVGTGKAVVATGLSLAGTDSGNYTVNGTAATTADISPFALTVWAHAQDKVYDGTTSAAVTLSDNHFAGDDVSDNYAAAAFADRNAGSNKQVLVSGISLNGADAGNYVLSSPIAQTTANVTPAALTISAQADGKIYDGGTAAAATPVVSGLVGGDTVTGLAETYDTKNVGVGKTLSVSSYIVNDGNGGNNYTVSLASNSDGSITPLAISGNVSVADKVYDATTAAMVASRNLQGVVSGDDASLVGGTAQFADKNVGVGKLVTIGGLVLGGADAGNYTLTNPVETATASISPLAITGSVTAADKVYDATTLATITSRSLQGVLAGDDVKLSGGNANFDTADAGSGKTVTAVGLTLAGADAGNYTVNSSATTTANVTPAHLTVLANANSKTYGLTTSESGSVYGIQGADAIAATFASAGDAATADAGAYAISALLSDGGSGKLARDYVVDSDLSNVGTLTVNKAHLTVTANSHSKTYGQPATDSGTIGGIQNGDPITAVFTSAGDSATADVGSYAIAASLSDAATGKLARDYVVDSNLANTGTLTINPAAAQVAYSGDSFDTAGSTGTATIALQAQVKDNTGGAGSVTHATVTFCIYDSSGRLLASVPGSAVSLINASDRTTGTSSASWSVNLGTATSATYRVVVMVTNDYTGSTGTGDLVTVSLPSKNQSTGGGYVVAAASGGSYAADAGTHVDFGFNVSNATGAAKGNINVIFRRTVNGVVHTYQIQTTSISSYGANSSTGQASCSALATLTDVTNSANPQVLATGLTLNLSLSDGGSGTASDSLAITLWSGSSLLFSSDWNGLQTVQQTLSGGNVQVH